MNQRSFFAALFLFSVSMHAAPHDPDSLGAELRRLKQEVREGRHASVPGALPAAWQVTTRDDTYSISTLPLRQLLQLQKREEAVRWLDHLGQVLQGSSTAPSDAATARTRLDSILARREFAGVGPPSALELLRQRIAAWFLRLLERIFTFVSQHPTTSQTLFWVLAAGSAAVLVLWLYRLGNRDRTLLTLQTPDQPALQRPWQEWIATARQAAAQGDLRQAIHCAYWAGVARLQDTGTLSRDLTHTPREYLQLLSESQAGPHLAGLTTALERFWYAGRVAAPNDFRDSLHHLEALGCKTE